LKKGRDGGRRESREKIIVQTPRHTTWKTPTCFGSSLTVLKCVNIFFCTCDFASFNLIIKNLFFKMNDAYCLDRIPSQLYKLHWFFWFKEPAWRTPQNEYQWWSLPLVETIIDIHFWGYLSELPFTCYQIVFNMTKEKWRTLPKVPMRSRGIGYHFPITACGFCEATFSRNIRHEPLLTDRSCFWYYLIIISNFINSRDSPPPAPNW
jgi:hypothetical protein